MILGKLVSGNGEELTLFTYQVFLELVVIIAHEGTLFNGLCFGVILRLKNWISIPMRDRFLVLIG